MNENSTILNAYDGKHDEYGHDLPRWMNFEHVIDIGEADPTQTATDYYGFELPNGVAMVIQSQPSHRDHPFIVYSYGDGACFHDDVEFDSLRTAISYASQLHSGAIDPDYLRVEYTHDEYGLDEVLREVAKRQIPLLGICLGLQLLFERSDETPGVEGLGILKGEILRIPDCPGLKIPHMGWNSLKLQNDGRLFKDLPEEPYVYFVHSYYLKATDESIVKATTEYSTHIHASVEKDNIFACQFHPEKSSDTGLQILKNFVEL